MIQGNIENKSYYLYALDVVNDRIKTGVLIKLSCQRFLDDLKREDLIFRVDKADEVINFIGIMKHSTGDFNGKPFTLLAWQQWVVASIYGFYWLDGCRKYTTAYIEIARKNGKTQLSAALALYSLIVDGGNGA